MIPKNNVYWYLLKKPIIKPPLNKSLETTVAIVGGGMAGLSAAQYLHDNNIPVILIEKNVCGGGASGKSSGFISPDAELELSSLMEKFGIDNARSLWNFAVSGVDHIKKSIEKFSISCDYQVQDSLFISNGAWGYGYVQEEHKARTQLNYPSTLYTKDTISSVVGSSEFSGAVRYPNTFGIVAYMYCQELKERLQQSGVLIYENTAALSIDGNNVVTPNGTIKAERIISCLDRFTPDIGGLVHEVYHAQTFLMVTAPLTPEQINRLFPSGPVMVWDTELVFNYFRVLGDNRLLIGGATLYSTYARNEVTDFAYIYKKLMRYINYKFPWLTVNVEYIWPGLIGISKDLVQLAGFDTHNPALYYVSSATGLPWATALGIYAAEKFMHNRADMDHFFAIDRPYPIGRNLQRLLGDPITFALSNSISKFL